MKKIFCIICTLLLLGTAISLYAASGRESKELPPQEVLIKYGSEDHGYQQKDINGVVRFKTLPDGSIVTQDASGNTDFYIPSNRVVTIDRATQLSSWTDGMITSGQAATAGQSYYQCAPGTTYLVDLWALAYSGVTAGNGISAFTAASFTGVTMILPDAARYSGPAYDVSIALVSTGSTGFVANATASAGTSIVWVWPYAGGSGLSGYGKGILKYAQAYRSACTPQSMATFSQAAAAGTTLYMSGVTAYTGASYWMLDKVGESTTFRLQSGGTVSAYVVNKQLTN